LDREIINIRKEIWKELQTLETRLKKE